ncbi:MAG: NADPH-dependent glutamate synthase [Firmicutes bacterium]|nr:NADPH-dependent glutamate synthase [Bacillota bacterium]MCM1400739.1 NADPH-dependent glutamate synthase [Bacteroides sp.]MCM1476842.1 NADPH-dependent glutamate synthase [Bacteroides sp.]
MNSMEQTPLAPRDAQWREELRKAHSAKQRTAIPRVVMPQLPPDFRVTNNEEVNTGLSAEQAVLEATRCMDCPDPQCVTGCPVSINIPGFIKNVERGDFKEASRVIKQSSALPAVCGRVCPQEKQCESRCIYHKMKKAPVAIGYLERFVADEAIRNSEPEPVRELAANAVKIAVAGSGPAGLSFAGEMAQRGYAVTVFEALHEIGGVLKYGIPEFRLPNSIVDHEIEGLKALGVKFRTDCVIGKTISYDELLESGFRGVFVASGAGLPRFMGIPGENLIGVMSSNEYLTRVNLMGAGREGFDTPVIRGHRAVIVGGGNTAMDSVRTARRMGAGKAMIVYRRSEAEMPARVEEVAHAREEGVEFLTLHNPVEYLGDENGRVRAVRLQRMMLGEPDESGRRSPVPVEGDIVEVETDMVIVSVGVSPNPLIPNAIDGLTITRRGTIEVDECSLESAVPGLFAGGDIVRGGATVILAMGDGRRAAASMDASLKERGVS